MGEGLKRAFVAAKATRKTMRVDAPTAVESAGFIETNQLSHADGGPAFPVTTHPSLMIESNGMSLRDYFAAKALSSIGEDVHSVLYHVNQITGHDATGDAGALSQARESARKIALACGIVADAMLKAREAK